MRSSAIPNPIEPAASPATAKLRILQMGPTGPKGGVSRIVTQLSAELARQGHDVLLIGDGGEGIGPVLQAGARYEEVAYSRDIRLLARQLAKVRRLVREFDPDVIHVHGRAQSLLVRAAGRTPDWFTLHSTRLTESVAWYDYGVVRRLLSPLARRLFVLDPIAVEYLRRRLGVAPARVRIVRNGVDSEMFTPGSEAERRMARERLGLQPADRVVAFVGRFHEHKNPQAIVRMAAAARDQGIDPLRVVMVGEGPLERELRSLVGALGLADHVSFHGWMHPLDAYRAADLFVMPSPFEGYGLAAAEALACGTPVLRSRTGGFESMIVEGSTGWGCDPNDEQEFICRSLDVLATPARLASMRTACRTHAIEHLSLAAQARQTVEAYRSADGRRSARVTDET